MFAIILILIHIIGAVAAIIVHYQNGTFEWVSKYGDGIRIATPADIVFVDLFLWELIFLAFVMSAVGTLINGFLNRE